MAGEELFERWVEAYSGMLYGLALRLLRDKHHAEDVVQETFSSAWKSRERFDSNREEKAWLTSILRRRAIDHIRKKDDREKVFDEDSLSTRDPDPFRGEFSKSVRVAIEKLPQELSLAIKLVVIEEFTHREAADRMGVPLGTALSRVSRARAKLHELLTT